jgi:membrane protease YdiL (CAAX protease family)
LSPKPTLIQRHSLVFFFALAFLFTWANWLPRAAADRGWFEIRVPEAVALIAGYGPALAAVLVAGLAQGRAGLRRLFAGLARWRVGLRWYLAALLIPPALQLAALGLNLLLQGEPFRLARPAQPPLGLDGIPLWGQGVVLFLIFILGFDGLGEELGWRGFALPRLQEKRSPLVSSLILGFFWALWHLPYMLSAGSALAGRPFLLFLLNVMGISIIYTWLYNGTRRSTLLAILFHASGNTTAILLGALVPAAGDPRVYLFGTALNWLLAIFLLLKLQPLGEVELIPEETPIN